VPRVADLEETDLHNALAFVAEKFQNNRINGINTARYLIGAPFS